MSIWIGNILLILVCFICVTDAEPKNNDEQEKRKNFKLELTLAVSALETTMIDLNENLNNRLDDLKATFAKSCGVAGGWGLWTDWGNCNKTCGGDGVKNRTRLCNIPSPEHGETTCSGPAVEYQICAPPECSKELELGETCLPDYTCRDPNAECIDTGDGEKCTCKASYVQKQFHDVQACTEATTRTTSVVVLGGGMAGVMAAKTLHDAGITDIKVVEARSRLGGRISHIDWNGYTIERGASWIQGLDGNPIWDMAQEFKLNGTFTDFRDYTARDASGNDVTEKLNLSFERLVAAQEFENEMAREKLQNNGSDINKLVALRLGGWTAKSNTDYAAEYLDYDYEYADNIEKISLKYGVLHSYIDFADKDYRIVDPRGYRHIVQAIADKFLTERNTMLNETVSKIETLKNRVRVTLLSGEKIEAAYAIMTFSHGVLQNNKIAFEPPLAYEKKEALHAFRMSHFTRVVMKFPSAFWDETEHIVYIASRPGYYVIWDNLNHAKVHPGSNILMTTITGDEARRVASLTEAEIQAESMGVLRSIYGRGIPDPDSILINSWTDNPVTMGSFSSWPIGFDADDHHVMTSPIGKLHFAGEHHSFRYNGYTHGAYLSGIDAANVVIKCMKTGC